MEEHYLTVEDLVMFMVYGEILGMDIMVQSTTIQFENAVTADIGDHAISLGFEYEQRTDRYFGVAPIGLLTYETISNSHTDYGRGIDETLFIIILVLLLK